MTAHIAVVCVDLKHLDKEYKALAVAAMRLLGLHATTCAPERNGQC